MTEITYIPLNRYFQKLNSHDSNIESKNDQNEWKGYRPNDAVDWSDIENRYRTVLLAEGGAGKTCEMKERCRAMQAGGNFAFFIPIEALVDDTVEELLKLEEQISSFEKWKNEATESAWIFLDAVDELKLKDGDFSKSLKRLKLSLLDAKSRARIIISCRPSDWDKIDIDEFEVLLPAPEIQTKNDNERQNKKLDQLQDSEDFFLAPLIGKEELKVAVASEANKSKDTNVKQEELCIYKLCDLDNNQIQCFINEYSPGQSDALLSELELKDRWDFGRRPQDLIEMIALWAEHQTLGTYTDQQIAFLRTSLRERDGRPGEEYQLSQECAFTVAARLAFALAVSKERTIQNPTSTENGKSGLSVTALLSDIKLKDIKALIRLRLFDPPTYDRIRFHRRDIEEYLAAHHLHELFCRGIGSKQSLIETLFTLTSAGRIVIIPSMKNIAVWLAQWNEDVKEKFIEIDPVLLISEADSELISIEDRCRILKAIIKHPDSTRLSDLPLDASTLRRFASQDISSTINELWDEAKESENQIDFLISLIEVGKIKKCESILSDAVFSENVSITNRIIAMRSLIESGDSKTIQSVVKTIFHDQENLPAKMIRAIASNVYPQYITTKQLCKLIKTQGESSSDYGLNFTHSLRIIIDKLDANSSSLVELRNAITLLILNNQEAGSSYHYAQSEFSWLSPVLELICQKQSSNVPSIDKESFLHSCITAKHFKQHSYDENPCIDILNVNLPTEGYSREEVFLSEYKFVTEYFSEKHGSIRVKSQYSLLTESTTVDKEWLRRVTIETDDVNLSAMSFRELLIIWSRNEKPKNEVNTLKEVAKGKNHLTELLKAWMKPDQEHPRLEETEQRKIEREIKETKRIEDWKNWRRSLIDNAEPEFKEEYAGRNLQLFHQWLSAIDKSNSSYQIWNSRALEKAFNPDILDRTKDLFGNYWRDVDFVPYSARDKKNSGTPYSWLFALNGVIAESETPGWLSKLSEDDVRKATELSQVEINGLASFLNQLAEKYPKIVADSLNKELKAQLTLADSQQYVPLLQDLTHSSILIKSLVSPSLFEYVLDWSYSEETEDSNKDAEQHNLSQTLDILHELVDELDVSSLIKSCYSHFKYSVSDPTAVVWLRSLFKLDAEQATTAIDEALTNMTNSLRKTKVISWLGKLFDPFRGISFTPQNPDTYPLTLSRLAKIAYTYILPSEDRKRESGVAYTPDIRDNAQGARSVILNQLISLQHPKVPEILGIMADDSTFGSVKQFLKERVHIITLSNLEPKPWTIDSIKTFEQLLSRIPIDRESLSSLMENRLCDMQHDISHKDYFPRKTVREITKEIEMQRFIALMLDKDSKNLYGIVREDEAADGKRTDIRILSKNHKHKAVIEIKLADKRWTVADLEKALEDQLKQQYLRHEDCRVGFLLITNHGGYKNRYRENSKSSLRRMYWKDPKSNKKMTWEDLILHLQKKASLLVKESDNYISLSVFGLDLRDPLLRPVH